MNPDTAKFRSISHYSYDKNISPISLGTTIGYVDNTGGSCRFMEMQQIQREQEPIVTETSKVVQDLMPSTINHVINSPENGLVFFSETDGTNSSNTLYGFKYQDYGERKQAAWFKWQFDNGEGYSNVIGIRYSFIIDDGLYYLNSDNFLSRVSLVKNSTALDPRTNPLSADSSATRPFASSIPIYLDSWVPISGGVYDSATQDSTFTHGTNGCVFDWHNHVTSPTGYSSSSEALFLQYTEAADPTSNSATWVTAGCIIPINNAKPAGVNNYSVKLNCSIQSKGEIAFRLYQPGNTSQESSGHMDTYGIMTLKYLKTDDSTHSTLTMSDTNNHLALSHAVGVKASAVNSGNSGGFNTGANYLWMSSEVDNNTADGRYVILPKINVINNSIEKIEIAAHVGNDTNGGEWPDKWLPATITNMYAVRGTDDDQNYEIVQQLEDVVKGTSFKVSGDWADETIYIGFTYNIDLQFPQFFYTQQQGESVKRDEEDYLVIHRIKVNTESFSSVQALVYDNDFNTSFLTSSPRKANSYYTDYLPHAGVGSFTIPVYKKNKTITFSVYQSSQDTGPFNLQSVTWEGDYNPKNYRRA